MLSGFRSMALIAGLALGFGTALAMTSANAASRDPSPPRACTPPVCDKNCVEENQNNQHPGEYRRCCTFTWAADPASGNPEQTITRCTGWTSHEGPEIGH